MALRNMGDRFGTPGQLRAVSWASGSGEWVSRTGRLQAVRAHVENNLERSGLTPANTARAFGISVRQLHMIFKPTGMTFSRYVLSRRLERVRSLLALQPRRKIIDLASSCGIESTTVFYRAFRNAFGVTPTAYRRSLLGTESAAERNEHSDLVHPVRPLGLQS
jgi:AraC-like DNA-binding protein